MLAFDHKANCYNNHSHIQRDAAEWVSEWLPLNRTEESCLEFGAGTGNFTQYLIEKFAHLEASDAAPNMLKEGRRNFPAAKWSERDAWSYEGEPHTWSFVASCSLLQWAVDPGKVLCHWARLLKPGGRHLSGIYIAPSLPELASLLPKESQFHWRSEDEWTTHFNNAGFTVLRSEAKSRRYVYPDAITLFRRLHGTGAKAMNNPLPIKKFKQLLQDYEAQYSCETGVETTWTFLRIETAV